jgi:hypothetical protein
MTKPNPIDLASLSGVKAWIPLSGTAGDKNIQGCITAWSLNFMRLTGRGPRNWQTATQSPFNQPVDYVEVYDSNSNNQLFLRNFPINSVASLSINGRGIPARGDNPNAPGYVIDDQGRSLAFASRGSSSYRGAYGVPYGGLYGGSQVQMRGKVSGVQNVDVSYNAGFNTNVVAGELYTIPEPWEPDTAYSTGDIVCDGIFLQVALNSATSASIVPPWASQANGQTTDGTTNNPLLWSNTSKLASFNTVTIECDTIILADGGVAYFEDGTPLVKSLIAPTEGEYYVSPLGTYLFNAADAGKQVLISYTSAGTPYDIVQATKEAVSLNYKRRDWEGVSSLSMKDVGQTTYTQFNMSDAVRTVVRSYQRYSR